MFKKFTKKPGNFLILLIVLSLGIIIFVTSTLSSKTRFLYLNNRSEVPDKKVQSIQKEGNTTQNKKDKTPTLTLGDTWYIQLEGSLNTNIDATVYDIDLFDIPTSVIANLKAKGKKVICYFNAGAFEDWRKDAYKFDKEDIGEPLKGWEGEYWLNIKSPNVRKIMLDRLALAKQKGCDGVDPDNVDAYLHSTGFNITYQDQLEYNIFLTENAHKLGLLIGLKNDVNQIKELYKYFDFAVNEECHIYNECDLLIPFIKHNKPVLNIEYDKGFLKPDNFRKLCNDAKRRKFFTVIAADNLDGTLYKVCK